MFGTGYYPSVSINNRTFRGDLNAESIKKTICAAFPKKPEACKHLDDPSHVIIITTDNEGISGNVLIFVVVLLVLVNVVLIVLYRRCTNKDI